MVNTIFSNNNNNLVKQIILFSILIIFEILSFIIKLIYRYQNQNIGIELFNLLNPPNISLFVIMITVIILLIILYRSKRFFLRKESGVLVLYSLILLIFLLVFPILPLSWRDYLGFIHIFGRISFICILVILTLRFEKRLLIKVITGTVAISLIYIIIISCYVISYKPGNEDIRKGKFKADIAVIFGAAAWGFNRPSPVFRERINKALELYRKKFVEKISVTGGYTGAAYTEAEVAKRYLLKEGVQEKDIIVENTSRSTMEQVHFIRDSLFYKKSLKNILVVSDFFHLRRISEICIFNKISIIGISSTTPLMEGNIALYILRESFGIILFWNFGF